jgi:hypothetical protein
VESLKVNAGFLIAEFQSPVIAEPRQRSFHHISLFAQTAAVLGPAWSQQRDDVHRHHSGYHPWESVSAVSHKGLGLATRAPAGALDGRDALE